MSALFRGLAADYIATKRRLGLRVRRARLPLAEAHASDGTAITEAVGDYLLPRARVKASLDPDETGLRSVGILNGSGVSSRLVAIQLHTHSPMITIL